ncbi:hypothetical protein Tco_0281953 [Tanacetum coccineum]
MKFKESSTARPARGQGQIMGLLAQADPEIAPMTETDGWWRRRPMLPAEALARSNRNGASDTSGAQTYRDHVIKRMRPIYTNKAHQTQHSCRVLSYRHNTTGAQEQMVETSESSIRDMRARDERHSRLSVATSESSGGS